MTVSTRQSERNVARQDRFLLAFANRGWRASMRDVLYEQRGKKALSGCEDFFWFASHRVFASMLPSRRDFGFFRLSVRQIWSAPDQIMRRELTAWAAQHFAQSAEGWRRPGVFARRILFGGRQPPLVSEHEPLIRQSFSMHPFYMVLLRAYELAARLGCCGRAECKHPFFFKTRSTDRYCSGPCRAAAERARMRRWWEQHGKQWRAGRKEGRLSETTAGRSK